MNEILKLLENMGIPAICISIIGLVLKSRPITFLTSNSLERKISSKEWSFLFIVTRYFLETVLYSIILMWFSLVTYKWNWLNNGIVNVLTILIGIIVFLSLCGFIYLVEKKKRYIPDQDLKKNLFSLFIVFLYYIGWFSFLTLIIGRKAFLTFHISGNSSFKIEQIFQVYFVIFISSMVFPFIFKPLSKYFAFSSDKQFKVTIDNDTWFILNPITKEEFLLGNQPTFNESTLLKIVPRDTLIKSNFKVVNNTPN